MIFRRATVRLAVSFALVQLVLFAAFGAGIYLFVTSAFDFDQIGDHLGASTAETGFATLRNGIVVTLLALVLVIPVTSYLMAAHAMRPIRSSYEAQQRFVDDASHELRTPLTAIQAQLELGLSRPRSPAEYGELLGASLGATRRLSEVLDDLLALSRSPREQTVGFRPADLAAVATAALGQLSVADAARVRVLGDRVAVHAAESMLTRAVVNLVTNAIRYSAPGTIVLVRIARTASSGVITVEDRGPGMSRAERSRAFERFWQADESRTGEGRGLGLSIVQEIVRVHGGKVQLVSEPGVGTRVSIEIPLSS